MEEVINKTDGQFKNILDDLVDYNKHASQKDPIIKKLNSNPPASLNSSTYSSAASSSSSSSSSSSTSSASSSSSDPAHSPTSSTLNSASTSPSQNQQPKNGVRDEGEFEIARLEHLGRTAKILEHHKIRSKSSASSKQSHDLATASSADFGRLLDQLGDKVNYSQNGIIAAAQLQTIAQQKYTTSSSNAKSIQPESADSNSTASNVSSWKTISARRDKRKKKAVEIKIFAEHIPGNRGHATIDELTKFIESGTTNGASSSSVRGNKSKQQAGSSISNNFNNNNNSNHSNSGNGHSNNIISTSNNTKSPINNSAPNEINPINTTNNNINKKNESHLATMKKTNMATSKMITNSNNVVQNKNPPMQKNVTNQSTTTTRNSQQRSSKQSQNELTRESQDQKNANKVPQAPQQLPKSLSSQTPKQQPSPVQLRVDSTDLKQAPKQQQQSTNEKSKGHHSSESQVDVAVTFAHHLKVHDDDARQYTFGFFEEQSNQTQQTKTTTTKNNANQTILVDKNVNVIDAIKHRSLSQQSASNPKTISKQPKTSPNSEEKCSKSNDKIDANSFNYDQILKFISNRWVEAQKSATASKGY